MKIFLKSFTIVLLSSILCLYTNCGKPQQLQFNDKSASVSLPDSITAFAQSVHPVTRMHCIGCHTTQQPTHAHEDAEIAHNSLMNYKSVNLADTANSRIVMKLREGHNCWSNCEENADELLNAVSTWKVAVEDSIKEPDTTGTTDGGEVDSSTDPLTSLQSFEKYVYPITRNNCIGCHMAQIPQHASENVQSAHDQALTVVDFANVPASIIVEKMVDRHNCGNSTTCNNLANQLQVAITEWQKSRPVGTTTGGTTTGGTTTGGTTTGGTTTGGTTTGGTTTGGTTTGGTTDGVLTSLQSFTQNVYPISRTNCIGCHTSQSPRHASDNAQTAHDAAVGVVNFTNIPNSKIISMMNNRHNCGTATNCANIASQFQVAITEWKKARPAGTTTGGTTTGGTTTGGTTTGGTTTGGTTTGGTTTGGTTTGGTTTGGTTGVLTSLQSFTNNVYPITRNNCVSCHTTQSPRHASATPQVAHDAALTIVNFTTISNSKIIRMMNDRHNCGNSTNCANLASQFMTAITEWKKSQPTGGTTTGGTTTGGTTTGGTTTGGTTADGTTTGGTTTGGTMTGGTTTGGTTAGGSTGGTTGGAPVVESSIVAYEATVYVVSRNNCVSCHTSQSPRHASATVATAHSAALGLTDFNNPSNSKFVRMMNNRHNCGNATNCSAIANQYIQAITSWKTRSGR